MSAWRGEALKIIPKRSKSYLETVACIISTAQQANPKVRGQIDPLRDQLITSFNLVLRKFGFKIMLF